MNITSVSTPSFQSNVPDRLPPQTAEPSLLDGNDSVEISAAAIDKASMKSPQEPVKTYPHTPYP